MLLAAPKAAEAGDTEAMWGLSNKYWKGEGVEQAERIAVYWCSVVPL